MGAGIEVPHAVPGQPDSPLSRAYAELLRNSVDWVWQTDADLTLTYFSSGLANSVGRTLPGLAAPEEDTANSAFLAALQDRRPFQDCVVEFIDDEGRSLPCRLSGTPFHDGSSGAFAGYRGTACRAGPIAADGADEGATQQLMDLLQAALGEKDRLERRLAHLEAERDGPNGERSQTSVAAPELRSPLSAILAFSEVIRDRRFGDEPERYVEHAAAIHRGARQLLHLLNAETRPGKSQLAPAEEARAIEPRSLDIGEILRGVAAVLGDEAANADVQISTVLARDLPAIRGDTNVVQQILFQLLGRVIASAPAGTTVLLRVVQDSDDKVSISVVEGVAAEAAGLGTGSGRSAEPPTEDFEDATMAVLRHLADSMNADLISTGRPGQGGQAVLRLPTLAPRQD